MAFTELADIFVRYNSMITNVYIRAFLTLVIFFVLSKIVVYISEKIFLRLAKKTKTKVDDLIVEKTNKPVSFLLLMIGIVIAIQQIGLKSNIEFTVERILVSVIIISVGIIVIKIVNIFIEEWGEAWASRTKSKQDDNIVRIAHKALNIVAVIIVFLYLFSHWGIEIGPMIASLGIAGIAIAFALQNTLGNIFGGISMIIDKSVRVGDVIQVDDVKSGIVTDVGLRSTKIRTWDNEILIFPNGQLSNSLIHNVALPNPQVRVVIPFGVAYGAKIEKVKKLILSEILKIKQVIKDPEPFVRFTEMADSSLNFKAYLWVDDWGHRVGVKEEGTTRIYNALNKAKINIPFPQMDIYIKENKK